ncbi:MAG: hypothetical protein P4L95_04455 [Rouxiella aceris]|uniref:hypothetical protein n=1 Tax=Rouxiella aceris TaxID=2703884 RepID=UPI00284A7E47|nr:hypothetical protein [Rouxiella aceris]MDR3431149.1 hypothetical protein [Rouxiella aceris]
MSSDNPLKKNDAINNSKVHFISFKPVFMSSSDYAGAVIYTSTKSAISKSPTLENFDIFMGEGHIPVLISSMNKRNYQYDEYICGCGRDSCCGCGLDL